MARESENSLKFHCEDLIKLNKCVKYTQELTEPYPIFTVPVDEVTPAIGVALLLCDYYMTHLPRNDMLMMEEHLRNGHLMIKIPKGVFINRTERSDTLLEKSLFAGSVTVHKGKYAHISDPTKSMEATAFAVFWQLPFLVQKILDAKSPMMSSHEVVNLQRQIGNTRSVQKQIELGWNFLLEHQYLDTVLAKAKQAHISTYQKVAKLLITDNREGELRHLEEEKTMLEDKIANLSAQLMSATQDLKHANRAIKAWYAEDFVREDERTNELADFFNRMSDTIEILPKADYESEFDVYIHTYLEDIDRDTLERARTKQSTYWGKFYKTDTGKWFIDDILLGDKWKIRVRDTWRVSNNGVILAGRNDKETSTETTNFHISQFGCVSGYLNTLNQYNQQNDIIGALYTAIKATKGFNVADSAVSYNWICDVMSKINTSNNSCSCLYNTETGEIMSYAERYKEWKLENHKDERPTRQEANADGTIDIRF